jgi:hypothetical protein
MLSWIWPLASARLASSCPSANASFTVVPGRQSHVYTRTLRLGCQ